MIMISTVIRTHPTAATIYPVAVAAGFRVRQLVYGPGIS